MVNFLVLFIASTILIFSLMLKFKISKALLNEMTNANPSLDLLF